MQYAVDCAVMVDALMYLLMKNKNDRAGNSTGRGWTVGPARTHEQPAPAPRIASASTETET